jgi:2-isopropylmalate synthase
MNPQYETKTRRTFGGHGAHTDIVVASVKAYLAALNNMFNATGKFAEPGDGGSTEPARAAEPTAAGKTAQ